MQQDGSGRQRPGLRTRSGCRSGGVQRAGRVLLACVAAGALVCAGTSHASETQRIGGGGGDRTVRMDCGADAFIVSIWAWGGGYFPGDLSLVRALGFGCRGFGAIPTETETNSVAPRMPSSNGTTGTASCIEAAAMYAILLRAGSYIDAMLSAACRDARGRPVSGGTLNVGNAGTAGLIPMQALECPAGEALYRVDARVGSAIDSLQGFCRPFPLRPSFDEAPAEGVLLPVSVTNDASIRLRAHGATGPVTLGYSVPSMWSSRFELVLPTPLPGTITPPTIGTRTPVAVAGTGAAATSIIRVLRIKGPVPVVPVSARIVPVTLTVRDGAGRTSTRSFRVQLVN